MKPKTKKQLKNILEFAKRTRDRTHKITFEDFMSDELIQDAVLYCLGQIGETASNISDEEQEKYPELFWRQMIGLRNRIFHDYEEIDMKRVFDITQEPISQLVQMLESLLDVKAGGNGNG
ncbi:MAG: DUF86 domain-containing protein [Oscillospiraceae bacterium]|nr:DUF86 domain-containing protein [Oscillospiraceae bacterium]